MKKSYIILLLVLMMPFIVFAGEKRGTITGGNLVLRQEPSSSKDPVPDVNGNGVLISNGSTVTILSEEIDSVDPEHDGCSSKKWYKIKGRDLSDGQEHEGYGCTNFINMIIEVEESTTDNVVIDAEVIKYGTLTASSLIYTVDNSSYSNRRATLNSNERVPILEEVNDKNTNGCSKLYKILYENIVSYACTNKFKNVVEAKIIDNSEIEYNYEEELAKFPKSYQDLLEPIHQKHPNWRFYALITNLDFNEVVEKEKNACLIQRSEDGYKDTMCDTTQGNNYDWVSNTFYPHEGKLWVTPSREATAYYVDPRNYLTTDELQEKRIFAFEDSRAYTYQYKEAGALHPDLSGTNVKNAAEAMMEYADRAIGMGKEFSFNGKTVSYADTFINAGKFSKVSALSLIARVRTETRFTSNSVSGTFEFEAAGSMRSGYYNYFNIGAFGTTPIANGLRYAYNAGWNNRYKALVEGSSFLATKFIYTGQESQYLQKFNVNPNSLFNKYDHQYQTNIEAPTIDAHFIYWGYHDTSTIDEPIVFNIPVYNYMPDEPAVKPYPGSPNNWLKSIEIDGKLVTNSANGFDGNLFYIYDNNWDDVPDGVYEDNIIRLTVPYEKDKVNITATPVASTTIVFGCEEHNLKVGENIIKVRTFAENGYYKEYRIVITRKESESVAPAIDEIMSKLSVKYNNEYVSGLKLGTSHKTLVDAIKAIDSNIEVAINKNPNNKQDSFATGDEIIIRSGDETKTFKYVLYGDLNGDGVVNLSDLVHVRNIILETSNLTGANLMAADINRDTKVNLQDLVFVRNDILGSPISQE